MITSLVKPRHLRIAALAVGAVALAGAAVYVTASAAGYSLGFTPAAHTGAASLTASTGSTSSVCSDFISHFSSDLGTSQSKVESAFQQAIGQALADQVKNGSLTQVQADAMKKTVAGKTACSLADGLGKKHHGAGAPHYSKVLMTAAASALGITPQQLKTNLAGGMTLSQIAAAQTPPVTEDQFRAKLLASLKPLLDQAVTDKKMTSAQEQAILQRLQSGPIPFWDKPAATGTATN